MMGQGSLLRRRVRVATGGGGLFPNEPSGWTRFSEQAWDVAPKYTPDTRPQGWGVRNSNNGNPANDGKLTIQTDGTAPFSPSNVFRGEFTVGDAGGSAPWTIQRDFAVGERFSKLYMGGYFKWSSAFDNTSAGANSGTKWIWFSGDFSLNHLYTTLDGPNMRLGLVQQGGVAGNIERYATIAPTTNGNLLSRRGAWILIEMRLCANSGAGISDGTWDCWIDGVHTHNWADIQYDFLSGFTFKDCMWEPTYGGGNGTVPATQYEYCDHLRLSGSNT